MLRIEFFKDKKGEYRFRIKAWNGRILCTSEGYKRKANVIHTQVLITTDIENHKWGLISKW